jgi:hypothetical protein
MIPGEVVQLAVHLTIPASKQKLDHLIRQVLNMVLPGIVDLGIRLARILNHSVARELNATCWSIRSPASIPESIGKFVDSQIRTTRESFRFPESRFARRMQTKHQHHRHCGGEVECDFVANSDEHRRKYIRLSNGGRMGGNSSHAKRLSSAETSEIGYYATAARAWRAGASARKCWSLSCNLLPEASHLSVGQFYRPSILATMKMSIAPPRPPPKSRYNKE